MTSFVHVLFIFSLLQFLCVKQLVTDPIKNENTKLLIVSFDGFRNEYLNRSITPYLNSLRKFGTYADYLRNIFPTKTFPNHHTISTGTTSSVHGVMANSFYDNKLGELKYGYELFHYNEELIPIWILNQKAGAKHYSGCMMWPGSNFQYNGEKCTFIGEYNKTQTWTDRVDTVIKWFKDDKTPINLAMLYIEEPDKHAHAYGPESEVITDLVKNLDQLSEYIRIKLHENSLENVNIIQVSDHGMEGVTSTNFIDLTKVLKNGTYNIYGTSPVLQIVPNKGYLNEVYNLLKDAANKNKHFDIYLNKELPERWKYSNDRRTGPIVAVAKVGYGFQDLWEAGKYFEETYNITMSPNHVYGIHGYDNTVETMHPIFLATGPLIKEGHKVKPFDTLDLYYLFCEILNLNAPPNNGTLNNILDILKNPRKPYENDKITSPLMISLGIGVFTFVVIITGISIYFMRISQQRNLMISDEKHLLINDEQNLLLDNYISDSEEELLI